MAENQHQSVAKTVGGNDSVQRKHQDAVRDDKLAAIDALVAELISVFEHSGGYGEARMRVAQFVEEYSKPSPDDRFPPDRLLYHGGGSGINNLMDRDTRVAWSAYFPRLTSKIEEFAVHGFLRFLPRFVVDGQEKPSRRQGLLDELRRLCEAYLVERPRAATRADEQSGGGDSLPELHRLDKKILPAMLELGATSKEQRVTAAQIAEHVEAVTGGTQPYVDRLPELRRGRLTQSSRGKTGGHWLTPEGLRVANLLRRANPT